MLSNVLLVEGHYIKPAFGSWLWLRCLSSVALSIPFLALICIFILPKGEICGPTGVEEGGENGVRVEHQNGAKLNDRDRNPESNTGPIGYSDSAGLT